MLKVNYCYCIRIDVVCHVMSRTSRSQGSALGFYRVLGNSVFWPTGLLFCLPVTYWFCSRWFDIYRLLTGFVRNKEEITGYLPVSSTFSWKIPDIYRVSPRPTQCEKPSILVCVERASWRCRGCHIAIGLIQWSGGGMMGQRGPELTPFTRLSRSRGSRQSTDRRPHQRTSEQNGDDGGGSEPQ